jgi:hypothetical protein
MSMLRSLQLRSLQHFVQLYLPHRYARTILATAFTHSVHLPYRYSPHLPNISLRSLSTHHHLRPTFPMLAMSMLRSLQLTPILATAFTHSSTMLRPYRYPPCRYARSQCTTTSIHLHACHVNAMVASADALYYVHHPLTARSLLRPLRISSSSIPAPTTSLQLALSAPSPFIHAFHAIMSNLHRQHLLAPPCSFCHTLPPFCLPTLLRFASAHGLYAYVPAPTTNSMPKLHRHAICIVLLGASRHANVPSPCQSP